MKLTGEILAKSLQAIIKDKKIETIKEVMKNAWDESHKLDVPDWFKPETERFEYRFKLYINEILNCDNFHEIYNWAANQVLLKKLLALRK